ncbi:hypothetical protein E2C01_032084 [Portunus trituberculatus]|uniref:Uncharacterized protein n=1 Tax=Portunus trituberculatus TaxID=210409 RepID=A0A5B7F1V4_PORTR|nr:hypothetical protein [Portunus trituberculatus]
MDIPLILVTLRRGDVWVALAGATTTITTTTSNTLPGRRFSVKRRRPQPRSSFRRLAVVSCEVHVGCCGERLVKVIYYGRDRPTSLCPDQAWRPPNRATPRDRSLWPPLPRVTSGLTLPVLSPLNSYCLCVGVAAGGIGDRDER